MRILFTGASSFTGYWFVQQLAAAGHDIVATYTRPDPDAYSDSPRRQRVRALTSVCRQVFGCRFGDEAFQNLVRTGGPWNRFCHHAADVKNYRDPGFDVVAALANNTHQLDATLSLLLAGGCRTVVLTGSVFEGGEGAGSDQLPHFSPYGLSKSLTAEVFVFYAARHGLRLGKFVIPNPFGPHEEPRFTAYLMRTWFQGQNATVNTPKYVRDNVHVSLLARRYVEFVEALPDQPGFTKTNPSGYAESQGAFAHRLATEMSARLNMPCQLELSDQREFDEPYCRINTEPVDPTRMNWDEATAWDQFATYYKDYLSQAVKT